MSFFRRKRTKDTDRQDKMAKEIADQVLHMQSRIADYLNEKAKSCSGKFRIAAFVAFVALFGSYCLYLLIY